MIYTTNEILKIYKTKIVLSKAIYNKEIFRLDHGIYSEREFVDPMVFASKKYPNGIITLDSAFYYYDLTDVIANKAYLATSRNSNTINKNNIVQVWTAKDKLNQGKEKIIIDGVAVNIYNKERLLVELIRRRNQIPFDYYKEIILNYREIADELDMCKIEQYLSMYKNEYTLANVLLREVF